MQPCKNGWHVTQVSEEFYILRDKNAKISESIVGNRLGKCDAFEVIVDNKSEKLYFQTTKILESYKTLEAAGISTKY